ncbi:MAG TPA: hypothetical protein ENI34_07370 [candidate division WOR-3 bacterium]|uniref:Tetratricopeptide repeat protein n=1 Tax=candidate division WOR-3 bacterium TaxID=2052148 RepID=A0A9C9EN20_UNCW3|nr:hypothetical protein [candidate division WOR-3 bacterium]
MPLIVLFLFSQTELFAPDKIVRFADFLYEEKDYSAALNEYRRYLFLADSIPEITYERIIDCLVQLKRYDEAVKESNSIKNTGRRNFIKGEIFFRAGIYDSSRYYLNLAGLPYKERAKELTGLTYANEFRFQEAGNYLKLPGNLPHYKKPILGAIFSLLPGGGHFYCGRIGDGFFSLLIVGAATGLSYYYHSQKEELKFGVSLGTAVLFYMANIYGGINAVRNYNYYQNEKYLWSIEALAKEKEESDKEK